MTFHIEVPKPALTELTAWQLAKLQTVLQSAEIAAAWLAQEAEAELRQTPDALDHPHYVLWRIADGVARGLTDLREELIAANSRDSADQGNHGRTRSTV